MSVVTDDFAGPGGWDEGARMVGLSVTRGVEWDESACETARAAGHVRVQADVSTIDLSTYEGDEGHITSPSCTKFSSAGSGVGVQVLDVLADGIRRIFAGEDCREELRQAIFPVCLADRIAKNERRAPEKRWSPERLSEAAREDAFTTCLVLEPARRLANVKSLRWVAMEQVRQVMPLWDVYAECLRERGWNVWTGIVNSADYGVPQTRVRAIFLGHRDRPVGRPEPTHAEQPTPSLFGEQEKWVSMAEALGWDISDAVMPARGQGMIERHGGRPAHPAREPAPTVISKARSWERIRTNQNTQRSAGGRYERDQDRPAPTLTTSVRLWEFVAAGETGAGAPRNPETQPAATITGKGTAYWLRGSNQANAAVRSIHEPAPTMLFGHCSNDVRWYPKDGTEPGKAVAAADRHPDSVRVDVWEAGVLQSFPRDYPWRGSRSKQYEQVGNAVPPLLAAHCLVALGVGSFQLSEEVAS